MAQLYAHNTSDMAENTGLEKNILEPWNKDLERNSKKVSSYTYTMPKKLNRERESEYYIYITKIFFNLFQIVDSVGRGNFAKYSVNFGNW